MSVAVSRWEQRAAGATIDVLRENPDLAQGYLESLDPKEADALLHDWWFLARDEQLPPKGDWAFWMYLAGRGAGKTRTGAEWVRDLVKQGYRRIGMIAPTAGDARDVMVEGESGLLAVCWDGDVTDDGVPMGKPVYEPSNRRVVWANGARATLYSADEPERLRGPQHDAIWADELCAWRRPETWDLAMFGLRLGDNTRAFISTTPKPTKLLKKVLNNPASVITRGTTYSNRVNLAKTFFDTVITEYEGSRLGKQELMGVMLEEAEGALWSRDILDKFRAPVIPTHEDFYFKQIVVAVDPAVTAKQESDETGIVVVGLGNDDHGYVLADLSGRYQPLGWGKVAVAAYNEWQADRIVAEGNQGGDLVKQNIHTVNSNVPVRIVHASRGKAARAEPVSTKFEQGKVHMVGNFLGDLEDQMCVWEPLSGMKSPDRLDALVWAVTDLMIAKGKVGQGKLKGAY